MTAKLDRRIVCATLLAACLSGAALLQDRRNVPPTDEANDRSAPLYPHKIPRPSPDREVFSGFFAASQQTASKG